MFKEEKNSEVVIEDSIPLKPSEEYKLAVNDKISFMLTTKNGEKLIDRQVLENNVNPSELILSLKFDTFLETLKTEYDIIIIDNPRVGIVSDGLKTLSKADIPIYIFKANYSGRQFVEKVKELEKIQKIKHLNVKLNGLKVSKSRSGYGYGYGGYYEEENEGKSILQRLFKK